MNLKIPSIEIDLKDPYKHDLLGRKPFGDALTNLILNADSQFTLSIDGQWGDGKTTFVKMWFGQLRGENVRVMYFDAFAHDYGDDPFVPLSAEIIDALSQTSDANEEVLRDLGRKAAKIGTKILKIGGRVAVRLATVGIVGDSELNAASDIFEGAANEASDYAAESLNRLVESFHLEQGEIEEFRGLLRRAAESEDQDSPLVIIVDELDRCRPTYAIALLEKVKHFFSVEGVVFAFVMNSSQMIASVKKLYGDGIDANQYLHKFIDVETRLPSKDTQGRSLSHYEVYARHLLDSHHYNSQGDDTDLREMVPALAQAYRLSLRDLEKVCRNIVLFYSALRERQLHLSPIITLLAVLKVADRDSYDKISEGLLPETEAIERIGGSKNADYVRMWLLACLGLDDMIEEKEREHIITHTSRISASVHLDRREFLKYHIRKMDYFA